VSQPDPKNRRRSSREQLRGGQDRPACRIVPFNNARHQRLAMGTTLFQEKKGAKHVDPEELENEL
jgi:hypothetical protein